MKEMAVAEKYAQALFLALEEKKTFSLEETGKQLAQISKFIHSNEQLKSVLQSPLIPLAQKSSWLKKNIDSLFKKESSLLHNFLEILVSKKRLDLLPLIVSKFSKAVEESKKSVKCYVKTAGELDEKTKMQMEKKLSVLFGKSVALETSLHPELLAGVVVKAGDVVIDNSLRTQLKNMKSKFSET